MCCMIDRQTERERKSWGLWRRKEKVKNILQPWPDFYTLYKFKWRQKLARCRSQKVNKQTVSEPVSNDGFRVNPRLFVAKANHIFFFLRRFSLFTDIHLESPKLRKGDHNGQLQVQKTDSAVGNNQKRAHVGLRGSNCILLGAVVNGHPRRTLLIAMRINVLSFYR